MKYRELPGFETNEFKLGDKIHIYDRDFSYGSSEYTIKQVVNDHVVIKEENFSFHFKQCRKLKEIKPREFYLHSDGSFTSKNEFLGGEKLIRVIEVLED